MRLTTDEKRKTGYYWVYDDFGWAIARWNEGLACWWIPGNNESFTTAHFLEIGKRLRPPKDKTAHD